MSTKGAENTGSKINVSGRKRVVWRGKKGGLFYITGGTKKYLSKKQKDGIRTGRSDRKNSSGRKSYPKSINCKKNINKDRISMYLVNLKTFNVVKADGKIGCDFLGPFYSKSEAIRRAKLLRRKTKGKEEVLKVVDWLEQNKRFYLRISDFESWNIGEEIEVVTFDRNFIDLFSTDEFIEGKVYKPKDLFINSKGIITYKGNLIYDITFTHGTYEHTVDLDLTSFGHRIWSPINRDGNIRIDERIVHWSEFDKNTLAGWRGPMMYWDDLDKLPNVLNIIDYDF